MHFVTPVQVIICQVNTMFFVALLNQWHQLRCMLRDTSNAWKRSCAPPQLGEECALVKSLLKTDQLHHVTPCCAVFTLIMNKCVFFAIIYSTMYPFFIHPAGRVTTRVLLEHQVTSPGAPLSTRPKQLCAPLHMDHFKCVCFIFK